MSRTVLESVARICRQAKHMHTSQYRELYYVRKRTLLALRAARRA